MHHPGCEARDPDDELDQVPSVEALTAGTLAFTGLPSVLRTAGLSAFGTAGRRS